MNFPFLHLVTKKRDEEVSKPTEVSVPAIEQNSTEGGEFLDDAIRMKEQPFIHSIKSHEWYEKL